MPMPLAVTAPAVAALAAYINARSSLWYDVKLLQCVIKGATRMFFGERSDRLNPFYILEAQAKSKSGAKQTLLIFEGKRYSYAELYEGVLRYGAWLREKCGVKPKDIVAMDFQNSDTFIFIWWGLWSIGAKPAMINYNLTGASLAHCIKAATTALCLVDPNVAENVGEDVKAELSDTRFLVLTPDVMAEINNTKPHRYPDEDRSEDKVSNLAILIYTSGTTGLPKPALVSWGKCIVGSTIAGTLLGRDHNDIMYTSMPLYHSAAAILSFCASVLSGSTQALGRKFSTKVFWNDVRESGATSIQYVGETLRYLLAAKPQFDEATGECLDKKHNVRVAFGNGLRPDVWNSFKERFGVETILEFYASTEGGLATWNLSKNDYTVGAIGRNGWLYHLVMGSNVALAKVDWDTDMPWRDPKTGLSKQVKSGDPGEMLFSLPADDPHSRFQGYYGNAEATASKIIRDVFKKGDAWYRTGDVVRWDTDGRLYFHDRIGDTFRWKSENVSTAEVSHTVGLHPAIKEANVYGVQLPHHDGRAGCAAVLEGEATVDEMRTLADHVRSALPRYAQPVFLRVMTEMGGGQITGTNKQQKHSLREAGVKPGREDLGSVYWLRPDGYVPFTEQDWNELEGGRVKL